MGAIWGLGFRPFYLLAAVFASLSIALWALQYAGVLPGYLPASAWHGHEMLFGFTLAVITGFLFTAVRNWTGSATPTGGLLAAYALLWVAGRVLVLTSFTTTSAVVNAAFPLAVAIGIAVPLVRGGNKRNLFFVALIAGLGLAAIWLHASLAGWVQARPLASLKAGLDIVLVIVVVMGGRVIPMFTNNGVPGAGARRNPWVDRLAPAGVIALLAADIAGLVPLAVAIIAALAAAANLARLVLWRPWRTFRAPLVWILHAAYAWIVVHLAMRALASLGLVPESLALHALTAGAIGGMTIGMMTRTALGHTGRALAAGRAETSCYVLIQLAAIVRVFGGLFAGQAYVATIVVSAACWSMAFAIYAVAYWPVLTQPRIDGKPG